MTSENPIYLLIIIIIYYLFAFPQSLQQVKQMYAELKSRMEQSPALGGQGSRVQSIGQEAKDLLEETSAMMLRMAGKPVSSV